MKFMVIVIFFCGFGCSFSRVTGDAPKTLSELRKTEPQKRPSEILPDDYYLVAIAGLGIANDKDIYGRTMKSGITAALGFEIPVFSSHYAAFEIYGHNWYTAKREDAKEYNLNTYTHVSSDIYSAWAVFLAPKVYLLPREWPVRLSLHFGFPLFASDNDYRDLDFGGAVYYRLNKRFQLSLTYRRMFDFHFCPAGCSSTSYVPDLYMINCYYRFKI